MTTTVTVTENNLEIVELFPATKQSPLYFAEFGPKLPSKLKNAYPYFLHVIEPEIEEEPEETEEPEPKKRKILAAPETQYKLYMKATMNGKFGSKGQVIPAADIPTGTTIHLIKGKKYYKTMIYFEGQWSKI
jgi:hypothetical protein